MVAGGLGGRRVAGVAEDFFERLELILRKGIKGRTCRNVLRAETSTKGRNRTKNKDSLRLFSKPELR